MVQKVDIRTPRQALYTLESEYTAVLNTVATVQLTPQGKSQVQDMVRQISQYFDIAEVIILKGGMVTGYTSDTILRLLEGSILGLRQALGGK